MSPQTPQEEQELRERLRALRVDPPDDGFQAQLHRRLAAAEPQEEPGLLDRIRAWRWQPLLWPAIGVAAGVAVVLAGPLWHPTAPPVVAQNSSTGPATAPEKTPTTRVPASKVALVRLNLTTEIAADNAQIRVSLPEGLAFWSDGEALPERSFTWTQALAAGDNAVPIAIRGQLPGRYHVTVTAQTGSEKVEDEVVLEVTSG